MMERDNAIEIKDVVKSFKYEVVDTKARSSIFLKTPTKTKVNVVFKGITFNVKKGEVIGVIGKNGCGKSTLLGMVSKIIDPDHGTIETDGKIASILELGMGFHSEMSGRQNIYLRGELYGFSKKNIDSIVENIIDYSGVRNYIDNPIKTYSSGMKGRLAFAIMVNVEADIMLVDEVLSTGDNTFALKASQHFKNLAKSGKTFLIVSHNNKFIEEVCSRVIWIEDGTIRMDGTPSEVCASYEKLTFESPEYILESAENGVPRAQYELAVFYRDGIGVEKDLEKYEYWLFRAAESGHIQSLVEYGDFLLSKNTTTSKQQAMNYYQIAADKGNINARLKLSSICYSSDESFVKMVSFIKKRAIRGDKHDQFRYGDILLKTAISDEDKKNAFKWFEKSAMSGYNNAMHQVALMYRDGIGVSKDIEKMTYYLKKSSNDGYMPSIILLADTYHDGKIVQKNESVAFKNYVKGAKLGNGKCMYQVAVMYRDGVGVEKNKEESDRWFNIFAQSHYQFYFIRALEIMKSDGAELSNIIDLMTKCSSMNNVNIIAGSIQSKCCNDIKDVEYYFDRMKELAINGNIGACRKLGNYYMFGINCSKNISESIKWYEKACELGDSWSMNKLGEIYRDGVIVPIDNLKALTYFNQAVLQNNVNSMFNILNMDSKGLVESKELVLNSLNSLKINGNIGNVDVCRKLATWYYDGIVFDKDVDEAKEWYLKAAKLGDVLSIKLLKTRYGLVF